MLVRNNLGRAQACLALKNLEVRGREGNSRHRCPNLSKISPTYLFPLHHSPGGCLYQSTTPPHLSASGVNPSRLHRPCSRQGTGLSTSKLTPPLCPSDQMSMCSRSPASRVVPRRGRSPVKGHGCRLEGGRG
jgi:hypothetical protein